MDSWKNGRSKAPTRASAKGFKIDLNDTTFFLGLETLLATAAPACRYGASSCSCSRNAVRANAFSRFPERVVEPACRWSLNRSSLIADPESLIRDKGFTISD
jgi:hypothetical protein